MAIQRVTVQELSGVIELPEKEMLFVREWSKDRNAARAADAVYQDPSYGYRLIAENKTVADALQAIMVRQAADGKVTPTMVQNWLVTVVEVSLQTGKLNAANQALDKLARLKTIDAYASSKLDVIAATDQEMVDKIRAGRNRAAKKDEPLSFM